MSKELKIIKDLKKRNDRLNNQYMQEQVRNYHLNYVIDKYKSVLEEIKEYLEKESSHYAYEDDYDCYLYEEQIEELLQILDKVEDLC